MTATEPLAPEVRRLAVPVYLPWGMSTLGAGIVLPVLPLHLDDIGLGLTTIGVVTAASGIGSALGGIPASAAGARWGNETLLTVTALLVALSSALLGFTEVAVLLVVLRALNGLAFSGLSQSRQVLVAQTVPTGVRGRVNALVGGTHRLTFVIGPLLGGFLLETAGADTAFAVAGGLSAGALLARVLPGRAGNDTLAAPERGRLIDALVRDRRRVLRASLGPMCIAAARQGRFVVVPLIGDSLELGATAIGALVAVSTVADFALFPVAGYVSDRWGRLHALVPAFALMAVGLALFGLADTVAVAVVAGVVMGIGNGLSAGSMLTISSDLAPKDDPAPFLAGFHLLSGFGNFLGPFVVGVVADLVGLGAAAVALAVLLSIGVAWIAIVIGETGRPSDHT